MSVRRKVPLKKVKLVAKHEFPDPSQTYEEFIVRFPGVAKAWKALGKSGERGPLGRKSARPDNLAIAVGAM